MGFPAGRRIACALVFAALATRPALAAAQSRASPAPRVTFQFVRPSFRVAVGLALHPGSPSGSDPWTVLETQAGFVAAVSTRRAIIDGFVFAFRPEIGFSYDLSPRDGGARFTTGVGIGAHSPAFAAFWVPQLIVGSSAASPNAVAGVRNALRFEFAYGAIGLEASHSYLALGPSPQQSVTFVIALDPGLFVTWFDLVMRRWD